MAWSHIKDATTNLTTASGTTVSPTFGSNVSVGNQVFVTVMVGNVTTTASVAGFGATWQMLRVIRSSGGSTITLWCFGATVVTAGTAPTVTISTTVSNIVSSASEFSGGTLNIDAFNYNVTASSTAQASAFMTPQSANTLVIACLSMIGTSTVSTGPTSPWTNLTQVVSSTHNIVISWQVQTTATAVQTTYTMGTSDIGQLFLIALQAAGTTTNAYQVQGSQDYHTTSAALTVHPLTPTLNNTLIATVHILGTSAATILDGTNTWARQGAKNTGGSNANVEIWAAFNVAASAVSVECSTAVNMCLQAVEWYGIAAFDAVGSGATNTSATPSDGAVTNVATYALIISAACNHTASLEKAGLSNGFGSMGVIGAASGTEPSGLGAWKIVTTAASQTTTWTETTSGVWCGIAVSFKIPLGFARGTFKKHPKIILPALLPGVHKTSHHPRASVATGAILSNPHRYERKLSPAVTPPKQHKIPQRHHLAAAIFGVAHREEPRPQVHRPNIVKKPRPARRIGAVIVAAVSAYARRHEPSQHARRVVKVAASHVPRHVHSAILAAAHPRHRKAVPPIKTPIHDRSRHVFSFLFGMRRPQHPKKPNQPARVVARSRRSRRINQQIVAAVLAMRHPFQRQKTIMARRAIVTVAKNSRLIRFIPSGPPPVIVTQTIVSLRKFYHFLGISQ